VRVLHTVASIEEEASGPSYVVPALCSALDELPGVETQLHVLGRYPGEKWPKLAVSTYSRSPVARRLGWSEGMRRGIAAAAKKAALLHNHGLWMMPNVYVGWASKSARRPLVTTPHGVFAPWALARSRLRKRLFWHALQRATIEASACLHVTAASELEQVRAVGLTQPVAVLPFGIDIPPVVPKARGDRRRLLFLGRVHPAKGLERLIKAWARCEKAFPEWELAIAGPDSNGHATELAHLAADLGCAVSFLGPVYGQEKVDILRTSDVLVLPSYTENFGVVASEALAVGTPVLASKQTPWASLEEHQCGWWVDCEPDNLSEALRLILSKDRESLEQCGLNGRTWMAEEFSWNAIATKMAHTYQWVLGERERPSWVDVGKV